MTEFTAIALVRMTVATDAVADLASATRVARSIVDRAVVLAPEPVWRVEPKGPALPSDRLEEFVFPHDALAPRLRYTWVMTAGVTSTDLAVKAYVGVDGHVAGTVRWRFRARDELVRLEQVYESFWQEPTVEFACLLGGADFLLRIDEVSGDEQPGPSIGWRNWFRGPVTSKLSQLPGWCRVVQHGADREVVLGDDPFGLDPANAVVVRDALVSADVLKRHW